MSYNELIDQLQPIQTAIRNVARDDNQLADFLADALRAHPAPPPSVAPELNVRLQGNLTEFSVWDLGERYWSLYPRHLSWTANAESPWKGSSSDGVDIVAIAGANPFVVLLIEGKSSDGCGANLVTGTGSTLQNDFDGLFRGAVQNRLNITLGKPLSALRFVYQRPDMEEALKDSIGTQPSECPNLRLVGVLVCNRGSATDEAARERAFARLLAYLVAEGWKRDQIQFQTIEVQSLSAFLTRTIQRATRAAGTSI